MAGVKLAFVVLLRLPPWFSSVRFLEEDQSFGALPRTRPTLQLCSPPPPPGEAPVWVVILKGSQREQAFPMSKPFSLDKTTRNFHPIPHQTANCVRVSYATIDLSSRISRQCLRKQLLRGKPISSSSPPLQTTMKQFLHAPIDLLLLGQNTIW